jgi:hypothetical protein
VILLKFSFLAISFSLSSMVANIPSSSALLDDIRASVMAESHQNSHLNYLPNSLVVDH